MITLRATLVSGLGEGAFFIAIDWVRVGIERLVGFAPYPGTLNLRLDDDEARRTWQTIRNGPALALVPPPPESCGGRLIGVVLASNTGALPDIPAAVVIPDATRHGDDVLEVVAPVHVRRQLGLGDGDHVTVRVPGHDPAPRATG